MLSNLLKIQNGKHLAVNHDFGSVNANRYAAGGFTTEGSSLYGDPKNIQVLNFKNGKVIRRQCPTVALHEVTRRQAAKTIEIENMKIAKHIFDPKP